MIENPKCSVTRTAILRAGSSFHTGIVAVSLSDHYWISLYRDPRAVGRIRGHVLGNIKGRGPEVLLIDLALLVDDEGHYARVAPLGRPGNERKSCDHVAVDNVVVGTARRMFSLAGQDFEIVAMIGCLLIVQHFSGVVIALDMSLGDQRPQWA